MHTNYLPRALEAFQQWATYMTEIGQERTRFYALREKLFEEKVFHLLIGNKIITLNRLIKEIKTIINAPNRVLEKVHLETITLYFRITEGLQEPVYIDDLYPDSLVDAWIIENTQPVRNLIQLQRTQNFLEKNLRSNLKDIASREVLLDVKRDIEKLIAAHQEDRWARGLLLAVADAFKDRVFPLDVDSTRTEIKPLYVKYLNKKFDTIFHDVKHIRQIVNGDTTQAAVLGEIITELHSELPIENFEVLAILKPFKELAHDLCSPIHENSWLTNDAREWMLAETFELETLMKAFWASRSKVANSKDATVPTIKSSSEFESLKLFIKTWPERAVAKGIPEAVIHHQLLEFESLADSDYSHNSKHRWVFYTKKERTPLSPLSWALTHSNNPNALILLKRFLTSRETSEAQFGQLFYRQVHLVLENRVQKVHYAQYFKAMQAQMNPHQLAAGYHVYTYAMILSDFGLESIGLRLLRHFLELSNLPPRIQAAIRSSQQSTSRQVLQDFLTSEDGALGTSRPLPHRATDATLKSIKWLLKFHLMTSHSSQKEAYLLASRHPEAPGSSEKIKAWIDLLNANGFKNEADEVKANTDHFALDETVL